MSIDFYESLLQERREWIPVPLPKEPFKSDKYGVPGTIERIIGLSLCLELPVGAWIGAASCVEKQLSQSAIALLKSNIRDETRHERQFRLAAKTYPVSTQILEEAQTIADSWITHPDHTLVKAKILETGVFLPVQAILRFFGGQALDRMAADISLDEWRHVQCNWSVCEDLKLEHSLSLLKLSQETMSWIVSDLTYPQFDADFWMRQANLMLESGSAPEMESIFSWTPVNAFFEISGQHLSAYG